MTLSDPSTNPRTPRSTSSMALSLSCRCDDTSATERSIWSDVSRSTRSDRLNQYVTGSTTKTKAVKPAQTAAMSRDGGACASAGVALRDVGCMGCFVVNGNVVVTC